MTNILREQLIGAWRLVSYIERPRDGSPIRQPMTDRPQGLILYTPDGYMSAQLCAPERSHFTSGDWFVASPEEFKAEATTYIAYSGPWQLGEQPGTIIHGMDRFSQTGVVNGSYAEHASKVTASSFLQSSQLVLAVLKSMQH